MLILYSYVRIIRVERRAVLAAATLLVLLCGPDVSRANAPSCARPMLPSGGQRPQRLPAGPFLQRPMRRLARANLS